MCVNACAHSASDSDEARADAAGERYVTCDHCEYDRMPYRGDGECPRCGRGATPEPTGECAHCSLGGQHGTQCRECAGPVCRPGERPNGTCCGCGAAGWEGHGCHSCGAGFNGPNLMYYFGEWLSPNEIQRRADDEHSAQDTEDEEDCYPEMAYINHTQNDIELNDSPAAAGDAGPDHPPHDDPQQQSAGALTQPPEVATGLPAAEAPPTWACASRGRAGARARRRAGDGRSRSRAGDGEDFGSSDDGDGGG